MYSPESTGMSVENKGKTEQVRHGVTRVTPITPAPRPRPGVVITPRQERALRYLERKSTRKERISQHLKTVSLSKIDEPPLVVPAVTNTPAAPSEDNFSTVGTFAPPVDTPIAVPIAVPIASPITRTPIPSASTATTQQIRRFQWRKKLLLRHLSRKHLRQDRKDVHRNSKRLWLVLGSTILSLLIVFLSVSSAGIYTAYRFYDDTQNKYTPRVLTLRDLMPHDNLKMYDSKGVFLGQLTDQGLHTTVLLDKVSSNLINATVATEDKNFWTNPGVDLPRIIRAALDNMRNGRVVEGGSTITQQLVKNLFLSTEPTLERKMREALLAVEITRRYKKDEILTAYLNAI